MSVCSTGVSRWWCCLFRRKTGLWVGGILLCLTTMAKSLIDEMSQVSDAVAEDLLYEQLEASIPIASEDEVDYDFLDRRWDAGSGKYFMLK